MAGKLKALQLWCKVQCEGYRDVNITNMTTSWKSGLAFCAIIHKYNPELIDFENLSKENVYENCKLAFDSGQELGIPALLDPEDMVIMEVPDKLCIITYVSQYYNYFRDKPQLGGPNLDKSKLPQKRSFISLAADQPEKKKQQVTEKSKGRRSTYGDTCTICGDKVYLIERHIDNHMLYHRKCFRAPKKTDSILTEKHENAIDDPKVLPTNNLKESNLKENIPESMEIESNDVPKLDENTANSKIEANRYNLRARSGLKHFDNKVELDKIESKKELVFEPDEISKKDKPLGGRPTTQFSYERNLSNNKFTNSSEPSFANKDTTSNVRKYERRTSVELNGNKKSDFKSSAELRVKSRSDSQSPSKILSDNKKSDDNLSSGSPIHASRNSNVKSILKDNQKPSPKITTVIPIEVTTDSNTAVNSDSAKTDDIEKTEWQLEAERRRQMRKGKYQDPERAKILETLREKEKSTSNLSQNKTENNVDSSSRVIPVTKLNKTRDSSSPEFIECDSSGNPVPSKSLGNVFSPIKPLSTTSQSPAHISLPASRNLPIKNDLKTSSNLSNRLPSDLSKNTSSSDISNRLLSDTTLKLPSNKMDKSNTDIDYNRSEFEISSKFTRKKNQAINNESDELKLNSKQLDTNCSGNILNKFNELAKSSSGPKITVNDSKPVVPTTENKDILLSKTNNDVPTKPAREKKYISPLSPLSRLRGLSPSKPPVDTSKTINSMNISTQYDKDKYQPKSRFPDNTADLNTQPKMNGPSSKTMEPMIDSNSKLRKIITPLKSDFDDFYTDINLRRDSHDSDMSVTSAKSEILPVVPARRYRSRSNSVESLDSDSSRKFSLTLRPLPPVPDDKVVNHRRTSISAEKPIPVQLILDQLLEVDYQLQQLEKAGIILEQQIRQDNVNTGEMGDDDLMVKWFNLVNNKNALVRRECDLMYRQRQQELEAQHADVDNELRLLMEIPDAEKTPSQKSREDTLVKMLVETVAARNHIVDSIEEDRLRYLEEDQEIADMMQMKGFIKEDMEKGKLKTKKMKKEKKRKKFGW